MGTRERVFPQPASILASKGQPHFTTQEILTWQLIIGLHRQHNTACFLQLASELGRLVFQESNISVSRHKYKLMQRVRLFFLPSVMKPRTSGWRRRGHEGEKKKERENIG